ncbi:guanylate-binding protein 7-like [Ptychodera flava]|uniref:guanylate-binding protein 7-like n=1 Tax=Ptychodera flava TaxID=63121 RepID=UPI00396A5C30
MLMFALMALMSSVLVYNSSKSVYAGDLNKLSWVTELKNVFIGSGDGEQTKDALEDEFIKFFPNFMWLLRDSTMSFEPTRDDDAGNDVLKDMDKGKNEGSLNQNFEKDVDVFIARCGALMKPKKAWPYVGNINGHQFTKMLEQYMSVFSETKSINVGAAVTCVITSLLQEVVEMTFKDYCNAMDSYAKASLPCDNYEIIEKHNRCMYTAMKTFKDNAKYVNDAESLEKYRNTLKEKMVQYSDGDLTGGYLDNILKENEKKSEEKKKKTSEQILAMKESEDKAIRDSVVADIDDQKEQLETDFQERSGATQIQMETLRSTHDALVTELKIVLDKMNEEKKKKQEELTRKQKELMQLS